MRAGAEGDYSITRVSIDASGASINGGGPRLSDDSEASSSSGRSSALIRTSSKSSTDPCPLLGSTTLYGRSGRLASESELDSRAAPARLHLRLNSLQ